MRKSASQIFIPFLVLLVGLLFGCTKAFSQSLNVDGTYTIDSLQTVTVDAVNYQSNGSQLIVEGTLIVNGDLVISRNQSVFTMKPGARVIVHGNFLAENQVTITIAGYLFVYGNFDKSGSSGQDIMIIDQGKIYILGAAQNWGEEFATCGGGYSGTTSGINDNCDFGNTEDFVNNQDQFPPDLVDLVNCYDLSTIADTVVCEGQPASFKVASYQGVTYEWQEKTADADWITVGSNTNELALPPTSLSDDEKLYRVVVRAEDTTSTCKISISRNVSLHVDPEGTWTGAVDANWNNSANWSCNSLPTLATDVSIPAGMDNYPVVALGNDALARDLTIEAGASLTVSDNWMRISGKLTNNGLFDSAAGSISFEGNAPQTIPAGAFENDEILNLNINNSSGVDSQTQIKVLNSLKVEAGEFHTADSLLLVSTASRTAYIDGSGMGEVIGKVSMQRFLPNGFGYKYFSSPFSNTVVGDLSPFMDLLDPATSFPHVYEYLENRKNPSGEDLTGWQKYVDPAAALLPATGYAVNTGGVNSAKVIELSGTVNNGDVKVDLLNSNGTFTKGFNLVGNPYPSPVDWNLLAPSLQGIDNAIYFFTADASDRYTGTYTSYVNGVSTDGRSSSIIPSMQGFFVRVSDPQDEIYPATGSLLFTNAARTGNQVPHYFYQTNKKVEIPQIKIAAGYKVKANLDALVLYFQDGASPDFEKELDARKILNTAVDVPNFYSLSTKRQKLSINAVSYPSAEIVEIPLGITAAEAGEIALRLSEVSNTAPFIHIYLQDHKKKMLSEFEENVSYSFWAQKGENNDRFSLLLSSNKLSPAQIALITQDYTVYTTAKEIVVKLNLKPATNAEVILSSTSGQVLQRKVGKGREEILFTGNFVEGIYLVTLNTGESKYTKKVLFKD